MIAGYLTQNFLLELRKIFAYRAAFWLQFFFRTVVTLMVSYFLWKSIYAGSSAQFGGFNFEQMLLYMVFSVATASLIDSPEGSLSQQIFDGSFTRYIIYPCSFLGLRISSLVADRCLCLLQFFICLGIGAAFIPELPNALLFPDPLTFVQGLIACLLAAYLQFLIVSCLEVVAFWVDQVWNLMAMNRFIGSLLGGMIIPLTFFPENLRGLFEVLPYASMIQFPILSFLKRYPGNEWYAHALICLGWCAVFQIIFHFVLKRGLRQYTGVGQ